MGRASRKKKDREFVAGPGIMPDPSPKPASGSRPAAGSAPSLESPWFTPALGLILLAALIYRIAYFFQFKSGGVFFDSPLLDAHIYQEWGKQIAAGTWTLKEPFYFAPGYPYFLGLIYKLFSDWPGTVYIVQFALGLLNLVLIHRMAGLVFGRAAALAAASLAALYASFPFLEAKLMSGVVALTLMLWAMLVLAGAARESRWWRWLGGGLLMGLTSLVRPEMLLASPFLALWVIQKGLPPKREGSWAEKWRPVVSAVALLAAGWALAIAPAAIHNINRGGGSTLISSQGGITFYQSNNERARGLYVFLSREGFSGSPQKQAFEEKSIAEKALGRELSRSEVSSYWFGKGLDFITGNPGRFVTLLGMKLLRFVGSYEYSTEYIIYVEREISWLLWIPFVPFALLVGLAVPGIWSSLSASRKTGRGRAAALNPTGWLVLWVLAANLAACLAFYISSRYRLPSAPALMIFGGATIVSLISGTRKSRWFETIGTAAIVGLIFLVAHFEKDESATIQEANVHYNAGNLWQGKKEFVNAEAEYDRALEMDDSRYATWFNRGNSLRAQGRYREAALSYRESGKRRKKFLAARLREAASWEKAGNLEEARTAWLAVLGLRPSHFNAHLALGKIFGRLGETSEAIQYLDRAIQIKPESDAARQERAQY
jgi:tetratricopeptide (TPR) repeat protein